MTEAFTSDKGLVERGTLHLRVAASVGRQHVVVDHSSPLKEAVAGEVLSLRARSPLTILRYLKAAKSKARYIQEQHAV
jgi:hypothetical protein